ncbi:phosphonate ABC transporter, permease protein PhnE [Pinisolibacter aquiterrae]|uniref:phosphonate ABC transporter, permease protein PhnE n=1 Tax=Pinisolibacter aquiterrae TaxID=2815579 RepID=UPI001C3C39DB|nr:phosphonate ABC transporter, permease protein PhnE [Pinisolibacter aquiterrae]MBV5263758.1 phosphonate ABC transporter, permease protein PhnE [Pinisolibacter aquiterrae]MCC8237258.1 phosphonate ABC transporter, permease protein PhnE [Pinisolibacter aquiterrae]
MPTTIPRLADDRLEPLARAYADAEQDRRRKTLTGFAVLLVLVVLAALVADVDLPKFFGHLDAIGSYVDRLARFDSGDHIGEIVLTHPGEWMWGLKRWFRLLFETLLMAYAGTLLGAVGGFVLCFFAARNLARSETTRWLAARWLEFCRTVPDLVFALIFVYAFGLGAMPGVLAIAVHTTGALGKLFTEVVENVDMKPVEGTTAAGGSWVQTIRFAVLPQILSNFASYALLRFEVNVRGAAVMGFVGAGGIGLDLMEAIRKFYYADVSAMLVLIIAAVMLIDYGTEALRHRLIGRETAR